MYSRTDNIRRTVMIVDDEFVNREILNLYLHEEYNVLTAGNGREALDLLESNKGLVSMVLTDLKMPVMDGFELIRNLKADEDLGKIPVIVLTSSGDVETEIGCLKLGAADFLRKPYDIPEVIRARVRRIIELSEGRMIIQATEKDELTGLYVRDFFFQYAERMKARSSSRQFDALVLDVSRFHVLNELYGSSFGRSTLQTIAGKLFPFLEKTGGIACRTEQKMFFILCSRQEDYSEFLSSVRLSLRTAESSIRFGLRLGVCSDADKGLDFNTLFERARNACVSIDGDPEHAIAYYDEELHKKQLFANLLVDDFQKALDGKQFKVFYQPKYDIRGENPVLCSAEALVRWMHPDLGMVSPGIFIPLFEKNGLIQLLDHYVWKEAGRQVREWKDTLGKAVPVSVNVSRIDLNDPYLVDTLNDILRENGIDYDDILLEVTESASSDDTVQLSAVTGKLRAFGFRVEMDDFGSGYSSLNRLSEMPVDVIKLDMSFIRRLNARDKNYDLVKLVIDIAKLTGSLVVAEGVETEMQYQFLKEMGCDIVQGYYFSKPVPAVDFGKLLSSK